MDAGESRRMPRPVCSAGSLRQAAAVMHVEIENGDAFRAGRQGVQAAIAMES
jgi:hypothetical protein